MDPLFLNQCTMQLGSSDGPFTPLGLGQARSLYKEKLPFERHHHFRRYAYPNECAKIDAENKKCLDKNLLDTFIDLIKTLHKNILANVLKEPELSQDKKKEIETHPNEFFVAMRDVAKEEKDKRHVVTLMPPSEKEREIASEGGQKTLWNRAKVIIIVAALVLAGLLLLPILL